MSFLSIKNNINETGAWVTPYVMDPVTNTTLYAGYVNVWKTTNSGTSWTKLSTFDNIKTIVDLQVAPSNSNYIYVTKIGNVYRSSDGGATWTDITAGLPAAAYQQIAVASNNPQKIWLTLSGYFDGQKVYASTDGGATWANYSGTLPNLPFNAIVYHNNGGNDALYAGADVGVYYRDNTMADWELYQTGLPNTGLPNVVIKELEVHQNSGKLRAATFGRGLWQTDLVPPPGAALAFDGVNDYVSMPAPLSTSTTDVTLEAWVKWAGATGNSQVIFYNGNTGADGYGLVLVNDQINALLGGIGFFNSGVSLTVGTWTHLAMVRVGPITWNIYKDGVVILNNVGGSPNTPTTGAGIGASFQMPGDFFNGAIDEIRFWNVRHSRSVILATMNCELTGTEANLVAYYQFNQGLAGQNNAGETTLIDIAGGDNNGTLNNFALNGASSNWVAPGGVVMPCLADPSVGAALAFDGVNDYVSMPAPLSGNTTNVTMEAWVKWNGSTGNTQVIFYNGNPGADGYGLVLHNDEISALLNGVNFHDSGVSLTAGTWTHLALAHGTTVNWQIVKDGVQILSFVGGLSTKRLQPGLALGPPFKSQLTSSMAP